MHIIVDIIFHPVNQRRLPAEGNIITISGFPFVEFSLSLWLAVVHTAGLA